MRPTRLTPEVAKAICDARSRGASCEEAATAAGVDIVYISRWRRMAKKSKNPIFAEFARMWAEAEECAERAVIEALRKIRSTYSAAA